MHDNSDAPESRLLGGPAQENENKAEQANPIRVPVASVIAILLMTLSSFGQDQNAEIGNSDAWPSFRGPRGTGVATGAAIPLTWSKEENVAWRVALPDRGNATPIVWGDRVFVAQAVEKENRRTVMCFDRKDGTMRWQSGVIFEVKEPTNKQNPYCTGSPATDGKHVLAFFGSAGLYCYGFDGKELWHRELGSVDSWHGSGSSPVIHDGICYLNFGPGTESSLVACDVTNGEFVWKKEPVKQEGFRFGLPGGFRGPRRGPPGSGPPNSPSETEKEDASTPFTNAGRTGDFSGKGGFNGSWSTPVLVHLDDHDELVVVESSRVVGFDPKTGEELWTFGGLPPQVFATPAIGEGVIVAMGHALPNGTQIVALQTGGKGKVDESHKLWELTLKKECISSGIIANGHIFLALENGIGLCLDVKTGEKKWEKRIRGRGNNGGVWSSIVRLENNLLIANLSGDVFVIDASPEFKLLHSNFIGEEVMCASPVVVGNQLFLRTYDALWCIGAK